MATWWIVKVAVEDLSRGCQQSCGWEVGGLEGRKGRAVWQPRSEVLVLPEANEHGMVDGRASPNKRALGSEGAAKRDLVSEGTASALEVVQRNAGADTRMQLA